MGNWRHMDFFGGWWVHVFNTWILHADPEELGHMPLVYVPTLMDKFCRHLSSIFHWWRSFCLEERSTPKIVPWSSDYQCSELYRCQQRESYLDVLGFDIRAMFICSACLMHNTYAWLTLSCLLHVVSCMSSL